MMVHTNPLRTVAKLRTRRNRRNAYGTGNNGTGTHLPPVLPRVGLACGTAFAERQMTRPVHHAPEKRGAKRIPVTNPLSREPGERVCVGRANTGASRRYCCFW